MRDIGCQLGNLTLWKKKAVRHLKESNDMPNFKSLHLDIWMATRCLDAGLELEETGERELIFL
jgi:hypothetical protein